MKNNHWRSIAPNLNFCSCLWDNTVGSSKSRTSNMPRLYNIVLSSKPKPASHRTDGYTRNP